MNDCRFGFKIEAIDLVAAQIGVALTDDENLTK
jgi:hypothetical protein